MYTLALIRDLHTHMEWADATVWAAVDAAADTREDIPLKELLFHIHFTQEAFLSVWSGEPFNHRRDAGAFASLGEVKSYSRPLYSAIKAFVAGLREEDLNRPSPVPWAKFFARQSGLEPAVTTLGETLVQIALHSQYHRGQVNRRLREVGGEPPLVDYIAWIWMQRPAPVWG